MVFRSFRLHCRRASFLSVSRPKATPTLLSHRGSAAWAIALKSGRRPRRPARALAGGLRLITEGYRGRRPQGGDLGVTSPVVIYSVFCSWCSKTSCFTVFRAPRRSGILSWRYEKTTRFTWFWRSGGAPERKK